MSLTVVVKIGSSSLATAEGAIDGAMVDKLCGELVSLRHDGHRVFLVSSGAVSGGMAALGLPSRPTDMPTLQAVSAVGQSRLMRVYDERLARDGIVGAQVLLVPPNFVIRRQYLQARQTLHRLLELGCLPIINENDAVADDELRFGDNDRLAALVAHLVRADLLVLLTDTDGLFTADPRRDPGAAFVAEVHHDDPFLAVDAGGTGSDRGRGGMASKLTAARIASWSGVQAVIAKADRADVLRDAVAGRPGVGTVFRAHDRKLSSRKLWIAFASRSMGSVSVDDGARRAIVERATSLLPAGVVAVSGTFEEGDTVDVSDRDGRVFARGMAAMTSTTLRQVAGRRTGDLPVEMAHEVVHRDDLVVLPS